MTSTTHVESYLKAEKMKWIGKYFKSLLTNIFMIYNRLAVKLLEKETLSLPDIVDILGPRPFPLK